MKRLSLSGMLPRMLLMSAIAVMPLAVVSLCLLWSPERGLTTAVLELLLLTLLSVVAAAIAGRMFVMRSLHEDPTITARKAAEKQLRENHSLLRGLVDGITDPVYVKDARGRYLIVNRALADSVGRSPDQIVGADDEQLFGPQAGPLKQEHGRRVMASGFAQTYEETVAAPDYPRHYLTTAAPYHGADGQVAGLLGISRDITSQKRMEQIARDSEKHLRQVLDSLIVFITVMTPDGVVSGMNRALRQAVESRGDRVEQMLGKFLPDVPWWVAAPEARESLRAAISRTAQGETVRLDGLHLKSNQKTFILDAMLAPMFDAAGTVRHLIMSSIDITERKRAEERAREQQAELSHLERARTMGQMASGLAHELRQPLGAIVNYASACRTMLGAGRMELASVADALGEIATEATRASEIIRRLRAMVKKQRPEGRPASANELVREAVSLLSFDLRQAGIEPALDLAGGLPQVWADAVQIQQVLVNLVHNAIEAMQSIEPATRSLVLATRGGEDGIVRVDVVDKGSGVPPEDLGSIFDSFFTTKPQGLGMGLALCRTIIEDHGGHLSAAVNPAGGMTLSFTLKAI